MNHKDYGLIFVLFRDIRQFTLEPTYILLFLSYMNTCMDRYLICKFWSVVAVATAGFSIQKPSIFPTDVSFVTVKSEI